MKQPKDSITEMAEEMKRIYNKDYMSMEEAARRAGINFQRRSTIIEAEKAELETEKI